MRKLLFLSVLAFVSTFTQAQTGFDGKYQHPTSVKALCVEVEQTLVRWQKIVVELNGKSMLVADQQEKQSLFGQVNKWEENIKEKEHSWQRLGCASILYPKK